jgi:serine/threonine-protein kinase HipA
MKVYKESEFIGDMHLEDGKIKLEYHSDWKENGFALSYSLPLNGDYTIEASHNFFSNLLPEGSLRDMVCRKLKISADNDWELLRCLGKESAGALTIIDEEKVADKNRQYEKISASDLNQFSKSKSAVMPQIISNEATRLSLAGAQDKIAVFYDGEDYFLPVNGSPTNTILKFENEWHRQITVNEVFMTHLASRLGLPTCESRLYTDSKKPIAVFNRYDRVDNGEGLVRIHQEDTCQAMGRSQKIKYEKEGGPSFKEVLELVTEVSHNSLLDRAVLIQWYIFNILGGNSDGHGKNLSFFRGSKEVRLTPLYDLVCTRVFRTLDRKLAMSYAGTFDPDVLDIVHLEKWADEIGVTKKFLRDEVLRMSDKFLSVLPEVERDFVDRYGQHGLVQQIRIFINKQVRAQQKRLVERQ